MKKVVKNLKEIKDVYMRGFEVKSETREMTYLYYNLKAMRNFFKVYLDSF